MHFLNSIVFPHFHGYFPRCVRFLETCFYEVKTIKIVFVICLKVINVSIVLKCSDVSLINDNFNLAMFEMLVVKIEKKF